MEEKNHFWQFNLGHALTLFALAGGAIGFFLTYDHRIMGLESNQLSITTGLRQLADHVDRMDREGTQAGRIGMADAGTNKTAIITLTAQMNEISPKVIRTDANVEWISSALKNQNTFRPNK